MKTFYLAPDILITYILGNDKNTNRLIEKCDGVVTSAFCFHEVISALTEEEIKKHSKKIKYLLEKIPIVDTKSVIGKATVQREERRKHLREMVKNG